MSLMFAFKVWDHGNRIPNIWINSCPSKTYPDTKNLDIWGLDNQRLTVVAWGAYPLISGTVLFINHPATWLIVMINSGEMQKNPLT